MKNFIVLLLLSFISLASDAIPFRQPVSEWESGTGTSEDFSLTHDVGSGSGNPKLILNSSTGKWQFKNVGQDAKDLGSGSGTGGSGGVNTLSNAGFEDGTTGWTTSGGTLSSPDFTNALEGDLKYGQFVATTSGQYFEIGITAWPDKLGGGCMADFHYLDGDSAFTYEVIADADGTPRELASGEVSDLTSWQKAPTLTFSCPDAGEDVVLRIESTGAGTIKINDAYLGSNKNISPVGKQAHFAGSIEWPANNNCAWSENAASYSNLNENTDCDDNPRNTTGNALDSSNGTYPWIGFGSLKKGHYKVSYVGGFGDNSGSFEGTQQFRLLVESSGSDIVSIGATHKVEASSGTSNAIGPHLSFSFELDQDVSSAVLKLQGKTSNTSDEAQFSAIEGAKIAVYYFPTSNETQEAITPDSANFYVEGNVSIGVGNTIQASVSSSPLAWSASSMSMEMKEGSAKIPCSGGNSPTGLTCATGDEQLGWVIDFPEAGEYEVCANSVLLSGGNHAITQRMYLMDDLTSTTLTESQRGNSIHTGGGVNTYNSATICENFKIPSRGERRFLMLYESTNTDTYIILGRDGNTSEPDLKFWARKSAHYANRPILTNQNFTYGQEIKLIDKYNGQTAYRYCNRVGLETGEADITTTTVIEAISANLNPIKSISLDGVDFILLDFTVQGSGSEYRRIVYERDTGNIHTSRDVYSLSKETVYCMDYTK